MAKKPPFFPIGMLPIAPITRKDLLLIALFVFPCVSLGQQEDNFSDVLAKEYAKRNAVCSLVSQQSTPPQLEKLTKAEVAWVQFSSKEQALMDALESENLVSEAFAHAHSIDLVDARTNHLQAFFVNTTYASTPEYTPQNRDQALNKTYAVCLGRMTASDQELFIFSERAWIAYRDADIVALAAAGNDQTWMDYAFVDLTVIRSAQFTSIVQSLSQVPIATTPVQESQSLTTTTVQELPTPAAQNNFPNPEDVKVLAEFQTEAKAVLNALLAKKDDPFFKKADVIKNAPDLPVEISSQVSSLDSKFMELLHKPYSDKLLEPALNESAAVELLASWSKFTQGVKAGNVVDADLAIQRVVSQRPKAIAADYLPIWQTVGSWHDLFVIDEAKYYEHIDKGNSFEDLGKTSAAIKEYQAALDIIENPSTSEKIKKLREQSLGL